MQLFARNYTRFECAAILLHRAHLARGANYRDTQIPLADQFAIEQVD
jgi:hypothetical protein